ncbi:MAG: HNH endonuclease [Phycisphaerales bacterium]
MPLLYYWQPDNYRRDLDYGVGFHLSQGSKRLHEVDIGDSVWAFTRMRGGGYALAAQLVIKAKTLNPPGYRYGKYRVWGDLERSRYFHIDAQTDVESTLRKASGRTSAKMFAQAFQGHAAVVHIDLASHQALSELGADLPHEPRARILPEEKLEAELLFGNEATVRRFIDAEDSGLADDRRAYLYSEAPSRNRRLVRELYDLYDNRCQLCEWDPLDLYSRPLCEAHHLVWLSRGGEDDLSNMVLICPNHHRAIHRCDAPFDFLDLSFRFSESLRESLQLNRHLVGC